MKGNEIADNLSKEPANNSNHETQFLSHTSSSLKKQINVKAIDLWEDRWNIEKTE